MLNNYWLPKIRPQKKNFHHWTNPAYIETKERLTGLLLDKFFINY